MGESIDDAVHMIYEAIALHIEDLIAHGDVVPPEDVDSLPVGHCGRHAYATTFANWR